MSLPEPSPPAAAPAAAFPVRPGTVIRAGLLLAAAMMVAWQLTRLLGAGAILPERVQPGWAGLAALGVCGHFLGGALLWRLILQALGGRLDYPRAFRMVFLANLAKYLPGSVWSMVGRVWLGHRAGLSPAVTTPAMAVEVVCQVLGSGVVGACALLWLAAPPGFERGGVAVVLGLLAVGLHPRLMNAASAAVEALLERLGRPRALPRFALSYAAMVALVGGFVLNWLLFGAGFAALAQAFVAEPLAPGTLLALGLSFVLAWSLGFLAPFAPVGLGVRDAALVALVVQVLPTVGVGFAAVLAVLCRAWILLADGAFFVLASLVPEEAS